MKQADYQCYWPNPWMQESVSMHKSPTHQAKSEEKERKRDRKDKGQEADGKKGRPTKQKLI